jgi:hypothetical protein
MAQYEQCTAYGRMAMVHSIEHELCDVNSELPPTRYVIWQ